MTNQPGRGWLSLVVLGMVVTVTAQTPRPSFEAASVKKQPAFIPPTRTPPSPVVYYYPNATVERLVLFGYNVRDFQVIGGPEWIRNDLFEVNARAPSSATTGQMRLMVRSLLEDRFRLVFRREQREMQGSALVMARDDGRLGPGLSKCTDPKNVAPAKPIRVPPGGEVHTRACAAMSAVADLAAGLLGRPVVDKTGLTGLWSFVLTSARLQPLPPGLERDLADKEDVPSFMTALQEQLGLKLEPTRGPVDILVIESVQQPTEN
jgi:uncharacterized protein (TIGR03435 family)